MEKEVLTELYKICSHYNVNIKQRVKTAGLLGRGVLEREKNTENLYRHKFIFPITFFLAHNTLWMLCFFHSFLELAFCKL